MAPLLTISPGIGVGLGDAVVAAEARSPAVAGSRVVATGQQPAAGKPVSLAKPANGAVEPNAPELGVAAAQPVSEVAPAQTPGGPQNAPVEPPQPVPVSTPVAAPAPTPAPQAPQDIEETPTQPNRTAAVVKVPVRVEDGESGTCDGQAYVLTDEADVLALQDLLGELTEEAPGGAEGEGGLYVVFLDGEPVEVVIGPGLVATVCMPPAAPAPEEASAEAPEPES